MQHARIYRASLPSEIFPKYGDYCRMGENNSDQILEGNQAR